MERPKRSENKDIKYFEEELFKLAEEAKANNQNEIAVVLYTMLGSISGETMDELKDDCMAFSERMLSRIKNKREKPN